MPTYEIRVAGHLGSRWAAWFDGMDLTADDDGTSVLRGPVVDQSALHGLLDRLRDLGIPLRSLTELEPGAAESGAPRSPGAATPDLPHEAAPHNPSGATS
jgi:hypothetical protein